ncbi:perlucin-like isoform X2 [Ruditapes philippinarum]|uniref:perlucin-like isoform X2 n=1 Tax=Ruditapes philippinarum TaxID=129788 RepID=UPI00295B41F2|nr:perlucin-like isoform X2 [Ruditapes philippinarum]
MQLDLSGTCLDGFEHHDSHCYKVAALEASWMEAKMYCRLLGSDLAIIDDEAEEIVVEGMLAKLHGSHIDEDYWIAGTDIINENSWRWMTTDGSSVPITYTKWAAGRPDNLGGNENCLAIHYHKGRTNWNDYICNALHSFICETPYNIEQIVG